MEKGMERIKKGGKGKGKQGHDVIKYFLQEVVIRADSLDIRRNTAQVWTTTTKIDWFHRKNNATVMVMFKI